jgi:exosortase
MDGVQPSGSSWGLAFIGLGAALQLAGGYYCHSTVTGLALLPYLGGIALLLGGWRVLQWGWASIGFLAFMIPLPWRVENALGPPLQFIATSVSTYLLQFLGFMAFAEGYVIHLNDARIGVVEACSGLSMLITFIALATAAALVVKRPMLDRAVLVASSIPVALLANIARITLTGVLHESVGAHVASRFYHDLAGWLMIPLALFLYWSVIFVLSRLLIETKYEASHARARLLETLGARGHNRDQGLQAVGSLSWAPMIRIFSAMLLIVGAGLVHGAWTNRWRPSPALAALGARFESIPMVIGDWNGTAFELPAEDRAMAGAVACLGRRYSSPSRGVSVSVFLFSGLPGIISAHTPDVCYPGAGYTLDSSSVFERRDGQDKHRAQFRTALATRGGTNPSVLRIFWGWHASEGWLAPDEPRWEFADARALCKLYVVRETAGAVVDPGADPCNDFLRVFLPELDRLVFSGPK